MFIALVLAVSLVQSPAASMPLGPGSTIRCRILDPRGEPMPDESLVVAIARPSSWFEESLRTDAEGRVQWTLPARDPEGAIWILISRPDSPEANGIKRYADGPPQAWI